MSFATFFQPDSMAVIGVSTSNDLHPANVVYSKNLLRYPVNVFPVNPKGGTLLNQKIFTSITELKNKIDLALIAVRAELVPETLQECIAAGVKGAIIISGGFAEIGQTDLQDNVRMTAMEADLPVIGPNCLGVFSPRLCRHIFFFPRNGRSSQDGEMLPLSVKVAASWSTSWSNSR